VAARTVERVTEQRLPASVYWRRRFVVLGLPLILVAVLVFFLVNRGGPSEAAALGGATTPAPTPTHVPTPAPTGSPATTAPPRNGGIADCAAPGLTVAITPDAVSVPAGTTPTFTVTIKNAGNTQCVVDAGELQREVVIVSGNDRVWSSKDCAPAGSSARTLLLTPGMTDTSHIAWNRVRSAPGCPGGLAAPNPGTYQATVSLAGTSSGPVVFQLG
jgi:hypothetical protein